MDAGLPAAMGSAPSATALHAPGVLASAATGISAFIERFGGDVDSIFGNVRLAPDLAGAPTLKMKLSAFAALFEEAARQTRNGNFGLWFGNEFKPRDLGMWGYAAVSAPTLGSALENLVGLFPWHQESSAMRLVAHADGVARLEYQIVAPSIVERRQDAELSLGMFLNFFRECCGAGWAPEEVHFEHPKPDGAREHEAAFAAPVYFSQPTNALLFRTAVLSRPMPARDPKLLAIMRTCLKGMSGEGAREDVLLDRVKAVVRRRLPEGCPVLEDVAGELRVPTTAICRELHDAGSSYKDLVESVRRDLAISYMRQRSLPFSDMAMLLGYSELSAFSRAFRRWTGASPRTFRARARSA